MMIVPVLIAFGDQPDSVLYWATGYNETFTIVLTILCVGLILTGLFFAGMPVWAVWAGYRRLLSTTGRAPSDYLRMFGGGPVLVNMGVNGLIGMAYVFLVGGDLNGPTLGGIFTIMGFSAFGKHVLNILPVMLGGLFGGLWHALPSGLPLAAAGGALRYYAGSHRRTFRMALRNSGGFHSLGPGAADQRTGGRAESLQQWVFGRTCRHCALSHDHCNCTSPPAQAAGRGLLRFFEESGPIDTSRWRTHAKDHPSSSSEGAAETAHPAYSSGMLDDDSE